MAFFSCWIVVAVFSVVAGLTPQGGWTCRRVKLFKAPATAAAVVRAPAAAPGKPVTRLEAHFNTTMQNDDVPLFCDFGTYARSLPVRKFRRTGKYYRLCDYDFWADSEDVDFMAKLVEGNVGPITLSDVPREFVTYAAAPPGSGKTASGLVAFLASAEKYDETTSFTHYLYLAFQNNEDENFRVAGSQKLSDDPDVAETQGAAFAVECLERLLAAESGEKMIDLDVNPPPPRPETKKTLKRLLDKNFPEGARILIHVDEHGKMLPLRAGREVESAAFRRGFLETLANAERVKVFATYTELPGEIPSAASSATCRIPAPVPPLDVDQVIAEFDELQYPTAKTAATRRRPAGEQERLQATLKFRLAARLTKVGLLGVHLDKAGKLGTDLKTNDFAHFCHDFAATAAQADNFTHALQQCVAFCALPPFFPNKKVDPNAVNLLLGVPDNNKEASDDDNLVRQIGDVVVIRTADPNVNMLTSSLWRLLSINDERYRVYAGGQNLLAKKLTSTDLLSGTPLEHAYAWVLSCLSAKFGSLQFADCEDSPEFKFKCKGLEAGRLFKGNDLTQYDVEKLEPDVMYYVEEPPDHPRADIFFRTENNEVVLIDIGGSFLPGRINFKRNKLARWIEQEQPKHTNVSFHGVVLAPFVKGQSSTTDGVTLVRGEGALQLLGGLRQLARWLKN